MNILFTVCGRAGSKGIKEKNVRDFLEYPLPYYTFSAIDLFLANNGNDRVDAVVNTDSEKLIEITENNPFLHFDVIRRTPELGGDRVAKVAVIRDCLERMQERKATSYDMVVDLDLTSPLRKPDDLKKLIERQKETKSDVTFSVTDARRNPYFNMVAKADVGYKKVIESDFVARQQAPEIFDMNASMYAYDPAFLGTGKGVLDGYCEIIKMYDTGILDLDHANDFELMQVIAKYLFENDADFAAIYDNVRKKAEK